MKVKLLSTAASAAGVVGALVLAMGVPSVANATAAVSDGNCSVNNLIPTAAACSGFYAGNQLGESQNMADTQAAALAALGFVGTVTPLEHINLNDLPEIDFNTLLNGVTFIGVHWGGGQAGPGNSTAFYRLDLAGDAQLATISTAFASTNSGAVLYGTQPCRGVCGENPGGDVPEPATWAMMILGFGGVGSLMRRRRTLLTAA